jgi:hypothetical protein
MRLPARYTAQSAWFKWVFEGPIPGRVAKAPRDPDFFRQIRGNFDLVCIAYNLRSTRDRATPMFSIMTRPYTRLLVMCLALLLGISPLQGVLASRVPVGDHGEMMLRDGAGGQHHENAGQMSHDCDNCVLGSCCSAASSASCHCASPGFALFLPPGLPVIFYSVSLFPIEKRVPAPARPTVVFHPPIV